MDELLLEFDEGTIQPGEKINAKHLSQRLNISRGPVREALAILAGRGLVQLEKERGATLRQIDTDGVLKIWEIYRALLGETIKGAARRIDERNNRAHVAAAMARIREVGAVETTFAFYNATNALHFLLNDIHGNEYVTPILENLGLAYWMRYLPDYIDIGETMPQYLANYQRIVDGVLAGDGETAKAAWNFHVDWSIAQIERSRSS